MMARVEEWERIDTEELADYDVFRVVRHRARSPRTDEVREFHVLAVPACVTVIPFTSDGRVVLVEQYRHAVKGVSLEFPAGVVEGGEGPVAAGVRELEEETGWAAGTADVLGSFDADPAIQTNRVSVVVARGCTRDGERDQDDGEDVAVRLVKADDIDDLIRSGELRAASALSAWALYERSGR
jgi:ADP-ribose pyrophosphatase